MSSLRIVVEGIAHMLGRVCGFFRIKDVLKQGAPDMRVDRSVIEAREAHIWATVSWCSSAICRLLKAWGIGFRAS